MRHPFGRCSLLAAALLLALLGASLADAEVAQRGGVRVTFEGELSPTGLPRRGSAPVRVSVATKIASTKGGTPPQVKTITIAINRDGHFDPRALPRCNINEIQPGTTENALAACGGSLVGQGSFKAKVGFEQAALFPAAGKLYAFNGTYEGKPAILAHVFGDKPVPTSFTLPFVLSQSKGTFGTILSANLPAATGNSSSITELSLKLGSGSRSHGSGRTYLSASCPAPKGFRSAVFPFAKATYKFAKRTISSTLTRTCKALGK